MKTVTVQHMIVCVASASFAGGNRPMVRDSSSSRDGENILSEESSQVSFAAPLQNIT